MRKAATKAGATVKIVAPKLGGAKLADGKKLRGRRPAGRHAVGDLRRGGGGRSRTRAARQLAKEAAAVDFVRDAFGHLKAIASDAGGKLLLKAAGVKADAGVVDAADTKAFIAAAKTRQWKREPKVRMLP